jgi:hypothetical protein
MCTGPGAASVWEELKRRNVFEVAAAYAVIDRLLVEIASTGPAHFRGARMGASNAHIPVHPRISNRPDLCQACEFTPEGLKKK